MCHILFYQSLLFVVIIPVLLVPIIQHTCFIFLNSLIVTGRIMTSWIFAVWRKLTFICFSIKCFIQNKSVFYMRKCTQWHVRWHGCLLLCIQTKKKKFKRLYTHYPFLDGQTVPQKINDCVTLHSCMQPINCPFLVPQFYYYQLLFST